MKREHFILRYIAFSHDIPKIGGFWLSLFIWIQDSDLDSVNDVLSSYVPLKLKYSVSLKGIWSSRDLWYQ